MPLMVGNIVILNSGGPPMTVKAITRSVRVLCQWIDAGGVLHEMEFASEMLSDEPFTPPRDKGGAVEEPGLIEEASMKRQAKNSGDPLYRYLHEMTDEQLVAALHELADRIEGQALIASKKHANKRLDARILMRAVLCGLVLAALIAPAFADQTGIAECMSDHFHSGSSSGQRTKAAAT